jgi:thiol-disulfide isomerase/thioredoxin
MNTTKSVKRELIEWIVLLGIPVALYVFGLHTEVLGGIQRLFLATGLIRPTELPAAEQVMADYDLALKSMDGNAVKLSQFRGKAVFMNLWASWCPPCVAEMPGIQRLYEQTDTSKVVFVMLSLDENFEKARKFMKRKQHTFPVYQLAGALPDAYNTASIPATFIISPDGRIVVRKEGMAQYDDDQFIRFLRELAKH